MSPTSEPSALLPDLVLQSLHRLDIPQAEIKPDTLHTGKAETVAAGKLEAADAPSISLHLRGGEEIQWAVASLAKGEPLGNKLGMNL